MRVLIWTQYFWPENFHINAVARSMVENGVEVTVLTGKPNYPEGKIFDGYKATGIQKEDYSGITVIRVPLRQRGKNSGKGMVLNYLSFIASGYLFAPYALREKKFDVVFVYAPSPLLQALPAIYLAWLKRAPLVTWVQDLWPEALVATGFKSKFLLGIVGLAVRCIYRFSDSILIQSQGFRASVERRARRKDNILFFPNSSENSQYELSSTSKGLQIANDVAQSFSIVFAGNIGKVQSCETIIEAAKLLKTYHDIKFYLIGDGSMKDYVYQIVKDAALQNVIITGKLPKDDMSIIYESASVLLLTLKDDPAISATIPSKLQSYFAAGKPIIACSNGESAKVVIQANAGVSCRAGDAEALAKEAVKLYKMYPMERAILGLNGLKYFQANYQLNIRVVQLIDHFGEVKAKYLV